MFLYCRVKNQDRSKKVVFAFRVSGTPPTIHIAKLGLNPDACSGVGIRRGTDTDARPWPAYISLRLRLTRNVISLPTSLAREVMIIFIHQHSC